MDTTYRLISLTEQGNVGMTASSRELAKMVPGDLTRFGNTRLAIERTDWVEKFDKMVVNRSVVVEAESAPNEWTIGV